MYHTPTRLHSVEMLKIIAFFRRGAIRMITTTTTAASGRVVGPKSPWLMIRPRCSTKNPGSGFFRFWCCAENTKYNFFDKNLKSRGGVYLLEFMDMYDNCLHLIGSSQGWLAYKRNRHLYLIDPTTYHCIHLPPLHGALRDVKVVQLAEDGVEREGMAFMIFGSGHSLAFCWPRRSSEWTLFGGDFGYETASRRGWSLLGGGLGVDADEVYESIVYSSTHRRLFCLTNGFTLEAWDVQSEYPKLLWASLCETTPDDYVQILAVRPKIIKLKYLACAEESGDLFLVVRSLLIETKVKTNQGGYDPTVDFEVYKIDPLLMKVTKMKDSLEGLSIFVGSNHPVAIKHAPGIKPDSIYFTHDNRSLRSHAFVGIFDYRKRFLWKLGPVPDTDTPVWFTPTPYIRTSRCI